MKLPPNRQWLLPYHRAILERLVPEDDQLRDLLVISAPGLGLRRVVTTLLRVYYSPQHLVLLLNAEPRDVKGINHDLGTLGLRHDVIQPLHYEMPSIQRQQLYLSGGILSVTSRILIVDLLAKRLPTQLVTGVIVLHAERVSPLSIEAFILRVYREQNRDGFVKAFSDNAEQLAQGISTLQTVMGQLRLRNVDIWPRFHEAIDRDLGHRRADVVELHQPLTPAMRSIQNGIVECLDATLNEIRRSKMAADVEDFSVESAMHRAFDVAVRRQLDPVWHRLHPGMKQLVGDLSTLRSLLNSLIAYDAVTFYEYLEAIAATNNASEPGGRSRASQWLLSDAANIIFREARARLWQGEVGAGPTFGNLPPGLQLVLEEPPKWKLLLDVLDEIEQDIYTSDTRGLGNTILIMVESDRTVTQLRTLLSRVHSSSEHPGRNVMSLALAQYFQWKRELGTLQHTIREEATATAAPSLSEAMQRKVSRSGAPAHKRRRMRGGVSHSPSVHTGASEWDTASAALSDVMPPADGDAFDTYKEEAPVTDEVEDYFGFVDMDQVVVVHSYCGDDDDALLSELRPRYVIMYDPNSRFVRQVEMYRALHGAPGLRIYFLLYTDSVEEQRYLSMLRREKDAFEKLIRQKANMAIPLTADGAPSDENADQRMLRSLSTRVAGGITQGTPTVIVDMREFRSSLPSLLHAAGLHVVPCTLQVGDYVLSPDMCVERKSLTDLVQSLNSGRLYTQCEAMSMHYPSPIVLIEFDHERAFTLETIGDRTARNPKAPEDLDIQSKLVLLTLAFPRLRFIWASSPYASAEIFVDLKRNYDEPDASRAAAVGLDDEEHGEASLNPTPMDMLRAMTGVTPMNALYLLRSATNLQELSNLPISQIQSLIGLEPGRKLYHFLHTSAPSAPSRSMS